MMDFFITTMQLLDSQDVNWWTVVVWISCGLLGCFYQLSGLTFWWHPFTAEDPLVRKWWNAKFLYIYDEETNSPTIWWPEDDYIFCSFLFWVNYLFKRVCKTKIGWVSWMHVCISGVVWWSDSVYRPSDTQCSKKLSEDRKWAGRIERQYMSAGPLSSLWYLLLR